jgi:hypothetical protein
MEKLQRDYVAYHCLKMYERIRNLKLRGKMEMK